MQEAKKNVILRVFRTAHCPPGKYFFGVTCSALSVLLSGVPFYTVYRIIRLFCWHRLMVRLLRPTRYGCGQQSR